MKMVVLGLVLMAICIMPTQSQMDVEFEVADVTNVTEVTYEILVRNSCDSRQADVVLVDTLPAGMWYVESSYSDPIDGTLPEPSVMRNPDGTTKSLSWFLGDFETNQEKRVTLVVLHKSDVDVRYEDNVVGVPPKPEAGKLFASKVIFEVNGKETKPGIRPKINESDSVTYEIDVYHNDRDVLVRNIIVTDILPHNTDYVDGSSVLMYETPDGTGGEVTDFEPTKNDDGTLTWNFNDANDINLAELKNGCSVFIDLEVIVGSEEAAFANEVKASGVSGNKIYESGVVRVSSFR